MPRTKEKIREIPELKSRSKDSVATVARVIIVRDQEIDSEMPTLIVPYMYTTYYEERKKAEEANI